MASRPQWKPAGKGLRPKTAPNAKSTSRISTDKFPQAVDPEHAFERWVHRKDMFDRGLELLGRLDSSRWEQEKEWSDLTGALVAIDEALDVDADSEVRKSGPSGPAKTMYEIWKRQTMEKHSLTDVKLTKTHEESLSETVKQYADEKEFNENGRTVKRKVLPQIKYQFPAVPKKKVRRNPIRAFPF